jgi:hypothetical protein
MATTGDPKGSIKGLETLVSDDIGGVMGTRAKRKSEQTPDNTRFPSSQYDIQNASTQATQLHALAMPLRSHSVSKKDKWNRESLFMASWEYVVQ